MKIRCSWEPIYTGSIVVGGCDFEDEPHEHTRTKDLVFPWHCSVSTWDLVWDQIYNTKQVR